MATTLDNDTKTGVIVGTLIGPFLSLFMILFWIYALPFLLLRGWVLSILYGWFLQPLGLPALNVWHMIGLLLILNMLTPDSKVDHDEKLWLTLIKPIVKAAVLMLVLLTAFIIHGWI